MQAILRFTKIKNYEYCTVMHSIDKYVDENVQTNGMASYPSMFKRVCKGAFDELSHKHFDSYVTGFAGRHNTRSKDTIDQMKSIVRGMAGGHLTFAGLIADRGFLSRVIS